MGKYDSVIGDLKKFPIELTEGGRDYQTRVEIAKQAVPDKSPVVLARRWIKLRRIEDKLEARAKNIRLHLRACEQLMTDSFEAEDLKKLELAEGGTVTRNPEPFAYVSDREKYRDWCLKNGMLPVMSVPWQTTNSMAKENLLNGDPLPPGVDIFAKEKFVLRK